MPRKSKTTSFDSAAAVAELIELGVQRRQYIKASIRVSNAAGALIRRDLGWQPDLPAADLTRINARAAKILSATDPSELPADLEEVARALAFPIKTSRAMQQPAIDLIAVIELRMRKLARQFPVWASWAKAVKGFSDLGLAVVIAEAGALDRYANEGKLWKRLGLAPVTKEGKTKAASTWRKGGLTSDEWQDTGPNGPKYSPRRRASIFSQVGNPIIGGMGKGYRPFVGEDIEQNPKLTHYEKVFVHRLRYEAARDPTMRRPDTKEGKESFSKYCKFRAQRYTEKRLLKHLWQAWRRAKQDMSVRTTVALPAGEIGDRRADAGISLALPLAPPGKADGGGPAKASASLPSPQITPQGVGEAMGVVLVEAVDCLPLRKSKRVSAQAEGEASSRLSEMTASSAPPRIQAEGSQ